jgi:NAD(P)-dependent dehydrogenase (short-subunit alcohol dehydrogenase family)
MGLARMQGKSVVISGAAFGIGRATAAKFAEEGASLLVQDIQERPLLAFRDELQRNGATVEALVGDVSKVEDCQAMIRAAVETYGRVDVVVANAGRGMCLNQQLMTGTRSCRSTAEACS